MILLPRSLPEALALLQARPDACPVAGGTDLMVRWPERTDCHARPLLDLSGIAELRRRVLSPDFLELGATTTWWDVMTDSAIAEEFPLLACAARQVGAIQVQARGTWGGNVANASPAADGVLALMACDASVEVCSAAGREEHPIASFFTGYRQAWLAPGQLLTAIRVPRRRRTDHCFEKIGSRQAQTISKVGVAICRTDDGWRVAVGSMAPTARRCPSLERALAEGAPSRPQEWLPLIRQDLSPIDDHRSTRAYRERVLSRLLAAFVARPE